MRKGRRDLIGSGKHQLIPKEQAEDINAYKAPRRKNSQAAHQRRTKGKKTLIQHTGLQLRSSR